MLVMSELLYTPAQVSERLGLTAGMVRRYGIAYEAVTGEELPRDKKSRARLYDEQALGILEQARAVVKENPNLSAEDAVRACLGLVTAPTVPTMPALAVGEVLSLLRAQSEAIHALRGEVQELRAQLALPAPQETSQADYVARLEQLYAEADKRAQYAVEELKRRDKAPPRRGWWPWGKR